MYSSMPKKVIGVCGIAKPCLVCALVRKRISKYISDRRDQ